MLTDIVTHNPRANNDAPPLQDTDGHLPTELLRKTDAYWRAANCLSAGLTRAGAEGDSAQCRRDRKPVTFATPRSDR